MFRKLSGFLVAGSIALATPAWSVPILQIYIEGATYDDATETWVGAFSSSTPIRLWAVGNVSGPGGKGTISNVRLSIAYDIADKDTAAFTLTGSSTGGFRGFTDPSVASNPTFIQEVINGSTPLLTGGSPLPSHGEYGPGTAWSEYALGNFTQTDSAGTDFNGLTSLPSPSSASGYQINVYEILVSGTSTVHFDLYDGVQFQGRTKAVFAPFSHDGQGEGTTSVPDGGSTAVMLGLGLLSVFGWVSRRRLQSASGV